MRRCVHAEQMGVRACVRAMRAMRLAPGCPAAAAAGTLPLLPLPVPEKKRERIRPWAWIEETDWVLSNGGTRISYHAAAPFPSVWQWVDAHATHQVPFCRLSSENRRFPGSNP